MPPHNASHPPDSQQDEEHNPYFLPALLNDSPSPPSCVLRTQPGPLSADQMDENGEPICENIEHYYPTNGTVSARHLLLWPQRPYPLPPPRFYTPFRHTISLPPFLLSPPHFTTSFHHPSPLSASPTPHPRPAVAPPAARQRARRISEAPSRACGDPIGAALGRCVSSHSHPSIPICHTPPFFPYLTETVSSLGRRARFRRNVRARRDRRRDEASPRADTRAELACGRLG